MTPDTPVPASVDDAVADSARARQSVRLPSSAAGRVLGISALVTLVLIVLAATNAGGMAVAWEILHWDVSAFGAAAATALAARSGSPRDRRVRFGVFLALAVWSAYNIAWTIQALVGVNAFPSAADVLGLLVGVPALGVLVVSVRGLLSRAEEAAVYIDSAIVTTAIMIGLVIAFGGMAGAVGGPGSVLAFAYPLEFLALAAAGGVALVAIHHPFAPRSGYALVGGCAIVGISYLNWVIPAASGGAPAGQLVGHAFSIGVLIVGYGGITWREAVSTDRRFVAVASMISRTIGPLATGLVLLTIVLGVKLPADFELPYRIAVLTAGGLFLLRQGLLLRERSVMLDEVRSLHEENDRLVAELRAELVERARVQDRLVDTSRMAAVGELAAGVAHEVNNPLTGVLGYAEILLEDLDEDDPRRADVATIRSEAMRARAIVRALRDFARPKEPEPTPTDLPALVTRTLDLVRYPLVRAGVIITESRGELPLIELDPQAIQQVILNVLTNAMQAMPDGGTLQVDTSVRGAEAVVTITDSGVGMDESVAAQAFVPFFSARRDSGAPGLGLSVSLGLVESHRGTIRLHSRPGIGTTVEISLPMTPGQAAPASGALR